jgi:hypothetical protein
VVWRWQARFMHEGVDCLLRDKTRKPGKPPLAAVLVQRVLGQSTCAWQFAGGNMLRKARRLTASLVLLLVSSLGTVDVESSPASAATGGNHDLWIATAHAPNPNCVIQARITPRWTGWYHIHFWQAGNTVRDWNTPEVFLNPVGNYGTYYDLSNTDVGCIHRGQTVCGELWLWNRGRWVSRGLPCITH